MVGAAAARIVLLHPSYRGRDADTHAARTTIHAQSCARHPGIGFLVLDVGGAGCNFGCADPRHRQNHLRSRAALESTRTRSWRMSAFRSNQRPIVTLARNEVRDVRVRAQVTMF